MSRESITCPHCKATVRLDIEAVCDVSVRSHEPPPDATPKKAGEHPADDWTAQRLAAIPVVVTP